MGQRGVRAGWRLLTGFPAAGWLNPPPGGWGYQNLQRSSAMDVVSRTSTEAPTGHIHTQTHVGSYTHTPTQPPTHTYKWNLTRNPTGGQGVWRQGGKARKKEGGKGRREREGGERESGGKAEWRREENTES